MEILATVFSEGLKGITDHHALREERAFLSPEAELPNEPLRIDDCIRAARLASTSHQ